MIAFDFDGVICNTNPILEGHFFDIYGENVKKNQTIYEFKTVKPNPCFDETYWQEIPVAIVNYQHIAPAVHGSIEALEAFWVDYDMDYIQIITARESSLSVKQVTYNWCDRHFRFPYKIRYCDNSEDKQQIMLDMGVDIFVDDRFKTAQCLSSVLSVSYLFNQPWNKRDTKLNDNVQRINSLWEMKHDLDTSQYPG